MTKVTYWYELDGFWRDSINWDNGVPNGATDVIFVPSPYARTITIDAPAYAHTVTTYEPLETFLLQAPMYFSAGGGLTLDSGDFRLLSGGSLNGGTLNLGGTFELLGGALNNTTVLGTLDLSPAVSGVVVHNLIADPNGGVLSINLTGVNSTLTFSGSQTLRKTNIVFGQSGPLEASPFLDFIAPSGGAAFLNFDATTTLTVQGAANFEMSENVADAWLLHGSTTFDDGADFLMVGKIVNYGAVSMNSAGNVTAIRIGGSTTFASSFVNRGVMTLSDNAGNQIIGFSSSPFLSLFQNLGTFSGAGAVGSGNGQLQFVNSGVVNANGQNALTIFTGGTDVNGGYINVTGTGGLDLEDTVRNTNGHVSIAADDTLNLNGGSLVNGSLTVGVGATLDALGGASGPSQLLGVNVANYGLIAADDDTTLTLDGGARISGGLIEALNGGALALGTTTIKSAAIGVDGDESVTALSGASTTLNNVTLNAGVTLVQQDGDTLNLSGAIYLQNQNGVQAQIQTGNLSAIPLVSGQTWGTGVGVSGVTTLAGGGVLQLGNGSAVIGATTLGQLFSEGTAALVNYDTIQGEGNITNVQTLFPNGGQVTQVNGALTLINRGVIDASTSGQELGVSVTGAVRNAGGLLEATGGGQLIVTSEVDGGGVSVGAGSVVALSAARNVAVAFDDTLGDTGALSLFDQTAEFVNMPISGFYSDGLGHSDSIGFLRGSPASIQSSAAWTFHEATNDSAGVLTVTDPGLHQVLGSLVLAGAYINAGATITSANSDLFHVVTNGFTVGVTTTAVQSLA